MGDQVTIKDNGLWPGCPGEVVAICAPDPTTGENTYSVKVTVDPGKTITAVYFEDQLE